MDDDEQPSFKIFGRDVLKIPCFRNTFLYSISSYFGVGLITFLATSKPAFSSHVGFASFVIVTFGYYTNCRINYEKQKFQITQIQKSLHDTIVLEGTDDPKSSKPILEEV